MVSEVTCWKSRSAIGLAASATPPLTTPPKKAPTVTARIRSADPDGIAASPDTTAAATPAHRPALMIDPRPVGTATYQAPTSPEISVVKPGADIDDGTVWRAMASARAWKSIGPTPRLRRVYIVRAATGKRE